MSENCGQHWGQMPAVGQLDSGIIVFERTQSVSTGVFAMRPLVCDQSSAEQTLEEPINQIDWKLKDVPIGNPVMIHTIKLSQFLRQLDNNDRYKLDEESIPQLIPSINPMRSLEVLKNRKLNPLAIKELIRRAVTIIAVFHGYDLANKSAVDLLVDILTEYLTRLCQTIRKTTDSLELRSSNDFIDIIDRVFHDMNVPDFEALRQYDSEIRVYNQNLIKEVNRKMGINDSMINSNKIADDFPVEPICDNPILHSSEPQSEPKIETTLSLKSLLNSCKSGSTDDPFDLTPQNNTFE